MRLKAYIYSLLLITLAGGYGCKKDNYDEPESLLTGRVVFEGQPIGVRSNAVQLELWQHGYAFFSKIRVFVAPDGTYSARLFDGDYKMTRQNGGPWLSNTDSIDVQVRGNTVVDVPVTPYTFVKSATFQRNGATITATASLQTVSTANALESVRLYVFRTALVDDVNQSARTIVEASAIPSTGQPVSMNVTIPAALTSLDAVYVRVGVKTAGINELAYSPVERIALK